MAQGDRSSTLKKKADKQAGFSSNPSIAARQKAAASMKSAGVQGLSGTGGSAAQVVRFKKEQNDLRNEYNNKNTSDERKEEIVKDLRGVSRDLNNQNRAAALNQVIREFGPGSVTNTGGIMGSDAGARFQQLRGNPNFYQDGRPGLETFVGNQGAFKTGDKNLFKQVHPNPLKILLGAATQIGNVSPMGLVRNIEKIRTGQPLIDMSFMDRNKVDSPSRMKDFYSAYMEGMNKKIADSKSSKNKDQFDALPLDPQFRDLEGEPLDYGAQIANEIFSEDPTGDPSNREDLQDEMDRTIFNQYSLLQDPGLADTLLDDTEETDLAEAINPVVADTEKENIDESLPLGNITAPNIFDPFVEAEKNEFLDTYGVGSAPYNKLKETEKEMYERKAEEDDRYREGGRFDFDKEKPGAQSYFDFREDIGMSPNIQREYIMDRIDPNYTTSSFMPPQYTNRFGEMDDDDFSGFQDVPYNTGNIPAEQFKDVLVPGDPRLPIPPFSFPGLEPKPFKDGGSVNTYDVLKLINDTMNDG